MKREDFPAVWTIVRVKEIAQILYGEALQSEFRVDTGNILVYGSSGIIGKHNKSLREGPSIIIGRKGNVGTVYYVNQPFWCIDTAFYLDNISETVDIEFLAYALQIANLAQFTKSVAVPGIGRGDIENTLIPLPPLPEQRRIVAILSESDEIRKLRRRANEKAQKIVQALFYDMFGDCNPQSNYPEGWRVLPFAKIITSAQYGLSESLESTGGIGVLRMNNISTEGWLDFTDLKYFPANSVDMNKYDLRPGDILFNRTNSKELVGKTGLWEEVERPFTFASYIIRLRLRTDMAIPEYIWALLNGPYGKQQVFSISKQAVNMANINTQELGSIQIVLPPLSLQKRFATYLYATRDQLRFNSLPAQHLDTLHQSLLARAFTGDLTATWREQHAEELAQAARERDRLLAQLRLAPAKLVTPAQPTRSEISERQELLALLNDVQRALLAMLDERPATYYTANSAHEELITIECSLDVVRRELHFLAAAGWIKEQSLPAEGEAGVRYIPVYRFLLPDDDSQQPDIDQLIVRLGSEYPDEVLV